MKGIHDLNVYWEHLKKVTTKQDKRSNRIQDEIEEKTQILEQKKKILEDLKYKPNEALSVTKLD